MKDMTLLWWTIASMAVVLVALIASGTLAVFKTTPTKAKNIKNKADKTQKRLSYRQFIRAIIMRRRAKKQIARDIAEARARRQGFFGKIYRFFYRIFVYIALSFINTTKNGEKPTLICKESGEMLKNKSSSLIGICREKKEKSYTAILKEIQELRSKGARGKRKLLLNPYQILLIGFFTAISLAFVPVVHYNLSSNTSSIVVHINTFLLSTVNAIKVFVVDSSYNEIMDNLPEISNGLILNIYSVYLAAIHVLGPLFTAGFILSFFKEAVSIVRLRFHKRRKCIYIMSELNIRSLALANDIISDRSIPRRKKLILFTDVFEKDDDRIHELIDEAKHLGALCLKRDITGINLKYMAKDKYRKLYFLSENEEKNIKQALKMIQNATYNERCNVYETELYVFASTIESEALLDSVNKRNIKVRRINENKNLVYKAMLEYPIYNDTLIQPCADAIAYTNTMLAALKKELEENSKNEEKSNEEIIELEKKIENAKKKITAIEEERKRYESRQEKSLNIAIIGLGGYGTELLKTICWLGQVEGYHVNIHAFENGDGEEKIKLIAPELIKYNHKSKVGNSSYDIHFHNNEDVTKTKFFENIASIYNLTSVYVTLGDDELNIQTAMRIRAHLGKSSLISKFIPIYAVVFSQVKTDILDNGEGLRPAKNEEYKITFIGSLNDLCSLETIEQRTNEGNAFDGHLYWTETYENDTKEKRARYKTDILYMKEVVAKARKSFEQYEYNRKASMAQGLYYRILSKADIMPSKDKLGEYEHARWNMFMRAEGFVFGEAKKIVEKTHQDLVDFECLPAKEKKKDLVYDRKLQRLILEKQQDA